GGALEVDGDHFQPSLEAAMHLAHGIFLDGGQLDAQLLPDQIDGLTGDGAEGAVAGAGANHAQIDALFLVVAAVNDGDVFVGLAVEQGTFDVIAASDFDVADLHEDVAGAKARLGGGAVGLGPFENDAADGVFRG